MRPHAASTRPFCGCAAKLTSTAMSALPGHPPGPVDSEEEHGDGFHRQGGRREARLDPGDRLETGRTVDEHRDPAGWEEQDDRPPLDRDDPDRIDHGPDEDE